MTVECVPNFSEGRDAVAIAAIAAAAGDLLLDTTADPDHNRCVLTLAGAPQAVSDAAFSAARAAVARIDLTRHAGVHPRLGAIDVLPFVPLADITLEESAGLARRTGERIWTELGLPVYFYEAAALRPDCRRLEDVRRNAAHLLPDVGTGRHPTAGACVVGARQILIAWNINLRTRDLAPAQAIAREIRESSGGLRGVKALGLPLASRNQVQVSINLTDFEATPLHEVFAAVADACRRRGIEIEGSELIGMIPVAALERSAGHDLRWLNFSPELVLENRIKRARLSP